jgi:hypothetical protein
MSGDFAERLAAVDDAIAGAAEDGTGDGYGVEGGDRRGGVEGDGERTAGNAPGAGTGDAGGMRGREAGTTASDSVTEESVVGDSVAEESVIGDSVGGESGAVDVVALEDRVAELEAAVQALRGYAGSVRAVNDRVEERADAAVATAEDCRERVGALERRVEGVGDGFADSRAAGGGRVDRPRRGQGERRDRGEGYGSGERGSRGSSDGAVAPGAVEDSEAARGVGGSRDSPGGEAVPWPPAEPRAPYGDVDADDDREQPGLLARLRDAL